MSEPDWIVRVHGVDHRITAAERRDLLTQLEIADGVPPMHAVFTLSGRDVRLPRDWRNTVTFRELAD